MLCIILGGTSINLKNFNANKPAENNLFTVYNLESCFVARFYFPTYSNTAISAYGRYYNIPFI